MSNPQDRTVYKRPDKKWVNKRNDAEKPSSVHNTQKEAIDTAREMLKNQGGGELTVMARTGKLEVKIRLHLLIGSDQVNLLKHNPIDSIHPCFWDLK